MTDVSRQTGHVAHVVEIPHQKWQRGFPPTHRGCCQTCDWRGAERVYRSSAVRDAAVHVDAHRPPAPSWAQRARRR